MNLALASQLPPPRPAAGGKSVKQWLAFAGLLVLGAALGYGSARWGLAYLIPAGGPKWIKLAVLFVLPLAWLVVVGWHELGHVLAGWLVGGKFLLFVIGPLKWQRTPTGIRFAWNRSINLAGGLAACIPLDDRDLPRRIAIMIAGGPLASVVLALLAAGAASWLAGGGWVLGQHLALLTAVLSGVIFLVTVLPGEVGGFKTDGRRLVALARGDARSVQEAALLSLTVAGLAGVRPADYLPAKVLAGTDPDDGSLNTLYGHLNAYYHHADRGNLPEAQAHLDRVMAGEATLAPFLRDLTRAEYAWLLAQPGGHPAAARAWLETAARVEFDPATRLRAEAAVLLAEGRSAEAAAKAREGLHALDTRSLAPVRNAFAADALESVLRRAGDRPPAQM